MNCKGTLVAQTERLNIRKVTLAEAFFILELVNDPDWIRHIGDRNIHNQADAREFIENGPFVSYQQNGYGLYVFCDNRKNRPMGICGMLKRPFLDHPDIGYAILPAFRRRGLTLEACNGVLQADCKRLGLKTVHAMISAENTQSINLIERLGFKYTKIVQHQAEDTMLFTYSK
ncbi:MULTISPECIES: GNAT family N-acetyltransferase [Aliiglaciecola]|uniref:GNAT family N-acetyltransferase n=1 Tax=Aliiglaciecola TaxID=1406885 RepID=UPI001C0A242A|nr:MULTISPECIES: GNAT family N-acetyltransferase [Aliiglaciecola]MBU2878688.1 GNAT family N-acetyltransferase [Aliiglaciecola lipolytica]MDO6709483.1 GNAT family N-acetyltransferase [Aliiglaciecola sp. 2_MG-2023]MDO6750975.1 GNAT family N-acetyltransferase [Aliiglaciecola sp. 1_MG-2023]